MTDQDQDRAVLPMVVSVTTDFAGRFPSTRLQRFIRSIEGLPMADIMGEDSSRVTVFRALLRDYPDYDMTALWLHSFDVEMQVVTEDPFSGKPATESPPSAATTAVYPTTSTV